MSTRPDTLFPECGAGLPAGRSAAPRRCGRGATPRIERTWTAPRPNPWGRRTLVYRFRPLARHQRPIAARWTSARDLAGSPPSKLLYEVACNLIADYFQRVGGFRLADDAVVTAWADALAGDYSPRLLRAAIREKARSMRSSDDEERRDKRQFLPHPSRFPQPAILDHWIELSDEGRADDTAESRRALAQRIDDQVVAPRATPQAAPPERGASILPAADAAGAGLLPAIAEALSAGEQRRARRLWELLPERRRRLVDTALRVHARDYHWWFQVLPPEGEEHLRIRDYLRMLVALDRFPDLRATLLEATA